MPLEYTYNSTFINAETQEEFEPVRGVRYEIVASFMESSEMFDYYATITYVLKAV
jgi:hypothetical protein